MSKDKQNIESIDKAKSVAGEQVGERLQKVLARLGLGSRRRGAR